MKIRRIMALNYCMAMICCYGLAAQARTVPSLRNRGNRGAVIQGITRDIFNTMQRQQTEQRRQQAEWNRQQQAEQRRLQKEAENRARQLEVQRKKAEAEAAKAEAQRLEMARLQRLSEEQRMQQQLAEDRKRQLEMEKQKLALDRQRWAEEADHDGWSFLGVTIPSWLWKSIVGSLAFAILWSMVKKPFSK